MTLAGDWSQLLTAVLDGTPFKWHKVMSFVENSLVVPSPIGVPVTLNFTLVHMASVVGQVKVEGIQSLVQSVISGSRHSSTPLQVAFKTDVG